MMKSVKTLPLRLLQRAFALHAAGFDQSRRNFLKTSTLAAAAAAVSPTFLPKILWKNAPRTVVVGAGLGGLSAAWHLKKSGIEARIFEAGHRVGGRTLTVRNVFGDGTATDLGGEFVDSWHLDLRNLTAELGIELIDLETAESAGTEEVIFYKGLKITALDIAEALETVRLAIEFDLAGLPENPTFRDMPARVKAFDNLSISAYLKSHGITDGWLFAFLCDVFAHEYGLDATDQSALNLLTVLDLPKNADDKNFHLVGGPGSESAKIRGGAMTVCERLAEKLAGQIELNKPLVRLENAGEIYRLTFDDGSTAEADRVVLALPFTKLREIDLKIPLSEPKRRAISELGYGNSSKLILGFKNPRGLKSGFPAEMWSDLPQAHCVYDCHPGQIPPNGEAALTLFTGGQSTKNLLEGDLETNTRATLDSLNQLFPGLKKRHNKKTMLWPWAQNEWSKAAYSCYRVGQWQAFAGAEGEPEGRVYFSGEHCSTRFQGFMNGAVETGRLAAEKILAS